VPQKPVARALVLLHTRTTGISFIAHGVTCQLFEQPVMRIAIRLSCTDDFIRFQRLQQQGHPFYVPARPESASGLRMQVKYVCQNCIGRLVLPELYRQTCSARFAHPCESAGSASTRQSRIGSWSGSSIGTKTAGSVHITVMGEIGAVSLLDPERDGLRDKRLEFNSVGCGNNIHRELVMAAILDRPITRCGSRTLLPRVSYPMLAGGHSG